MSDWMDKVEKLERTPVYDEYTRLTRQVIESTRRMAHCDQYVMHAPGECEYCDQYPELQAARIRLGINFTGKTDPLCLTCPAEVLRPIETIERWYGNVPEDEERKVAREQYYTELDAQLREAFPDVDWSEE